MDHMGIFAESKKRNASDNHAESSKWLSKVIGWVDGTRDELHCDVTSMKCGMSKWREWSAGTRTLIMLMANWLSQWRTLGPEEEKQSCFMIACQPLACLAGMTVVRNCASVWWLQWWTVFASAGHSATTQHKSTVSGRPAIAGVIGMCGIQESNKFQWVDLMKRWEIIGLFKVLKGWMWKSGTPLGFVADCAPMFGFTETFGCLFQKGEVGIMRTRGELV